MGLFSKEKKITFDEILAGIEALTPEEKEKLISKIKEEANDLKLIQLKLKQQKAKV